MMNKHFPLLKNIFIAVLLMAFLPVENIAQNFENEMDWATPPKREFRGVWVATVLNIDYPEKPTTNSIALQEKWRKLLEKYKKLGLNAVVVQIRSAGEAFYPTELAPWSQFLTGEQGKAPDREYDPLKKMIELSHEMGFEFHAWFNPYRLTMNLDTINLSEKHDYFRHRDWVVKYGTRYYLNPGIPDVRKHLTSVVMEVVKKYDIDAVHFDDYFYPYKVRGEEFPDTAEFRMYGSEFQDIGDWRRSSVDSLILELNTQMKAAKPYLKFGISPFGVWRNVATDPYGSLTRAGIESYDDLYADILKWLREDWIDYVAPQLYWNIGFPPADYELLVDWWSKNKFGKQLYIGHAVYKIANNPEPAWLDPNELLRQINLNRHTPEVDGSILFSSKQILKNPLGVADSIRTFEYAKPALLPVADNLPLETPAAPRLKRVGSEKGEVKLKWKPSRADRNNPPSHYVVYRFEGDRVGDLDEAEHISIITPINGNYLSACDCEMEEGKYYTYVVTAVNRAMEESDPSNARLIIKDKKVVKNLRAIPETFDFLEPDDY